MVMSKILAYCFSYKETKQTDARTFGVSFFSGFSDEYPKEYEGKKDFSCYPVKEGDYSSIYMDEKDALKVYASALKEVEEDDYFKENWKKLYAEHISWEDFKKCWAIDGIQCEGILCHMLIDESVYEKLGVTSLFNGDYKKYREIAEEEYDRSLESLSC
jgi:hypothetical protein